MKLFTFPKYKIPTVTRYNRDKLAKSVKTFLSSLELSKDQREKVLDEEYNLSYLIQLPEGKHCFHNTGKAAGISEQLDPRVTDFIKKLIRSGCCRVKELESPAMDFVTDVLFEGGCSLDRYHERFYRERRKIRNLVTYVKMETRFSKIDRENVQHFLSSCREAKIDFTSR